MHCCVLSFGGPEQPEDVLPFLENVTRGRGVPPERLAAVAEHYLHFGGVSPINALNRDIIAARRGRTGARRNRICRSTSATATGIRWSRTPSPGCAPTGSARRWCSRPRRGAGTPVAASTTRTSPGPAPPSGPDAPTLVKLRQYYDHPLLIAAFADAIRAARGAASGRAPGRRPAGVHRAFGAGRRRRRRRARPPRAAISTAGRSPRPPDCAPRPPVSTTSTWCGSPGPGPPQVPWLEPDICRPPGRRCRPRVSTP